MADAEVGLVYGLHAVRALLARRPQALTELRLEAGAPADFRTLAETAGVRLTEVPRIVLDRLSSGLARGRVVAFEISNAVPADYVDWLRTSIICNFVSQGRGVAHVPPRKGSAEFLRELVSPHLPDGAFDVHVRVFEAATLGSADVSKTVLHMEGTNPDADLKWSNIEFQLPKSDRPFLALMAFDTLESVYNDRVLEQMSGVLAAVRRSNDVFVGFVTPQSASAAKLENIAHVVLHLDSVNGSVVLYGEKPYTELFNLSWDWSSGVPKAVLRPIV